MGCSAETGVLLLLVGAGLDVATGDTTGTEVALGLAHGGTTEEEGTLALGVLHGHGIEGVARATGSDDTGAGSLSETEGDNVHLGEGELTLVISDSANNDGGTVSLGAQVLHELGKGNRGTAGAGCVQAAEDGLGESRLVTAGKETEELHK